MYGETAIVSFIRSTQASLPEVRRWNAKSAMNMTYIHVPYRYTQYLRLSQLCSGIYPEH